jgi:FkbM family methyltransferase
MSGEPHRAKKIALTLVLAVLAVDVLLLIGGGAVLARSFSRSECPFSETLTVLRNSGAHEQEFASKVHVQTTEAGLDLWNTPEGTIWTAHGDTSLPVLLAEQQHDIYEPEGHRVRPGDIVLDCGANIGIFTRKALSRGAALVISIEPAPQTLAALRRNFDAEIRAGRVIVYPKGVWDRDSEMDLMVTDDRAAANSVVIARKQATSKVRVPLTTIDQIVAELKLPHVDFIKMDIEGAEKPALTGGRNTIRRFRPRMSLSTEHLPDDATAIPAVVKSIEPGYRYWGCDCVLLPESVPLGGNASVSLLSLFLEGRVKPLVLAFEPVP